MSTEPFDIAAAASERAYSRRPGARGWFHVALAGVLLLLVVVGFAPSFFLRPVFTDRPLPLYLNVHGAVLTLWFTLALVQPVLVAARRVALHRQLGVAGAYVALLLVPLSGLVAIRSIPRYVAAGVPPTEIQFIVLGDLVSLLVFSGLVACALSWRQHREWHRRFMVVASIMIIGPAVARLDRVGLAVPVPVVLLGLLATVGINDIIRIGRPHRATVVSGLVVLVSLGVLLMLIGTRPAETMVEYLGR